MVELLNRQIGVLVGDINDPFWGQVLEGLYQAAERLGVQLTSINENLPYEPSIEEENALFDEISAYELGILIDWGMPSSIVKRLLDGGMFLVHLTESSIQHPRSVAPVGLYEAAQMAAGYLADRLDGHGRILMAGGMTVSSRHEIGHSRINGFLEALKKYPQITVQHVPSTWDYDDGYKAVHTHLAQSAQGFDALFGLSDTLLLAARDAFDELGLLNPKMLSVGINGDPFALAAITTGKITATVETSGIHLGRDGLEIAFNVAQGKPFSNSFPYKLRLVTAQNIEQVAAEKLTSLENLPNRLVGFNRKVQQEHLRQLETSLEINRRVGAILDLQQLSQEIANLIGSNYGYDDVQVYRWFEQEQVLLLEGSDDPAETGSAFDPDSPLGAVLRRDKALFIGESAHNDAFEQANELSGSRSRLVLPIHMSGKITHLLDLRSNQSLFHTRQDLIGLQSLADQFGIAIRNAELYRDVLHSREEALTAQARAERADNLKTRLLANVSHELRTPLNIILGYSQAALAKPNSYEIDLPEKLANDLGHIYKSGENLIRLINDLLDLSRAEINELDLFIEAVNPSRIIQEAFRSIASDPSNKKTVQWKLEMPEYLPVVNIDPVRLSQILLNLLSNARKFTDSGEIVLGVDVVLPYLHLWVKDTGDGIPMQEQEHIFEPFVTSESANQRHKGIGLGLTITRRLIALHGGSLSLESQPGQGSIFHVYLPLPSLTDGSLPLRLNLEGQPTALVISHNGEMTAALTEICARQGLEASILQPGDDLNLAVGRLQPLVLAWDATNASPGDWAFIQKLRSHPQICQLPFLLLGQETERSSLSSSGATNVLLKPVQTNALVSLIKTFKPARSAGTVLIIDDDPGACDLYQSMLTREMPGYEITSLISGAQAIDYLTQKTPGMIILDLRMPDIDGFEVLEYVRSRPDTASVPVMVMTGRVLSFEDIKRLNYDRVFLQSKNVLTPGETVERVQQALSGADMLPKPTSELVKKALAFIHQNFERTFSLQEITLSVGVSKSYFSQIFREEMGLSLWEYLNRYRIQKARELLLSTSLQITEIAMRVGFEDLSYFERVFNKYSGCSPRSFRQQARMN